LHRKYLQPVFPIAIFSFDEPYRPERDAYQVRVPGFQVMDFNFLTIQLNRLDWREYLKRPNPVAAALIAKVIKQLTRKLGNLSPGLLARVNGLSLERVEVLAEDLLNFASVADLKTWLG
jgi:Domain of unknown function (DUF4351)